MIRYVTFASSGPLKNCYATIEGESETTMRQWLKLHFPLDWAGIYNEEIFLDITAIHNLKEIFAAKIGHCNP